MKYELLDNLHFPETGEIIKKGEISALKEVKPETIKMLLDANKIKKVSKNNKEVIKDD